MLQTRAKTQELREEVGQELLPAAGELIGVFNNFVDDVSPAVVAGFGLINDAIVATVDASQKGTSALEKYFRIFILGQAALYGNEEAIEEFNKALDENRKITNQNSAQIITSTGISMEFMDIVSGINKLYAETNENLQKNRSQILINTTQTKKFGDEIDKRLNPIFGEQNSLLLTNIQLETNRNTLMKLITGANEGLAYAQTAYNSALKEVNRLTIEENVNDAEAAIRKAELQTQIALLTDAQSKGKDVALDLQLAQAELAAAEYELANNSDALTAARNILTVAEVKLEEATINQQEAIEERNKQLIRSIELTEEQTKANKDLVQSITGIEGTDFGRLVEQGFVSLAAPKTTSAPVVAPQTTVSAPATGSGGQEIQITSNVVIEDETIATTIQKVNTKLQTQGKTFSIR